MAESPSITIDTKQLITAAVASIFEQHNPEALARAMAEVALKAPDRSFSQQTMLEAVIGRVVANMATDIVTTILEEHEDEFIDTIRRLCEDDIVKFCAKQVAAKITAALPR